MKRFAQLGRLGLLAAALAASSAAMADLTYGNIGDPTNPANPGVYFGSGNVDGNWTINTFNNIQVALRVKDRATQQTIDGSSGTYFTTQGLVGGNKAQWNYEFSVNLNYQLDPNGLVYDFSKVTVKMFVDIDSSAAENWVSLDVLNNWPDNTWWNGSGTRVGRTPQAGEWGVQQSVNPMFSDSGFNFNPGPGLYGLRLEVFDPQFQLLTEVQTDVQVVPEPSVLALVGIALGGLGWASRRRQQKR